MDDVFASIRDGLAALRESRRSLNVFGSQAHGFRTHAPLSEDAVHVFEQSHGVCLPVEYSGFLIHVGNGGAGPAYGLFKLGEMDRGHRHARWREDDGFVGVLCKSFPHSGPWNDLSGQPDDDPEGDLAAEPEYEEELNRWEENYWSPANVNGAIPICHLGCAYRQWLVVTGPEAGNVWCDDRADKAGLRPLEHGDSGRVSFLKWYRSWLDDALRQLQTQGMPE